VSMDVLAKRTTDMLEAIGLAEKAAMLPGALHHGERRRIALAQALAHEPMILLADEPIADLDPESRRIILSLLEAAHDHGTTVIIATHDPKSLDGLPVRTIHLADKTLAEKERRVTKRKLSPIMG